MEKTSLKLLIEENLSTREIAEKTGKSQTTIRWWLKRHGLKTKIQPKNKGGKPVKRYLCKQCGEDDPARFTLNRRYNRCISCHTKANIKRYKENKRKAVEYKGGKCSVCGYDKCLRSLDFHHIDPEQKDSRWKTVRGWKFERMKDELDKCVCVCRNCHGEIHDELDNRV